MRVTLFLILPALAFAVPEKRFVLDQVLNFVNTTTIVKDLQLMLDLIGSDGTEQACEQAGHKYLTGLLDHSVPLICHSFQELIHHFNLVPATTSAPGKRFVLDSILNLVNTTTIVKDLQLMLDLIGSDGTEQACEQAGHKYLTGLLDHSVPLICHSFQELIHHFNLVPATTTSAPGKRFVLDSILNLVNTTTIVKDLQLMLDLIGSDGTEQACEQAGHKYLTGLLDHSVPLICHSFQELIHHFNLVPATTTSAPGKRFVLDSILNLVNTTTIVKDLQLMLDLIGSDGTEQACEQAGHKYLTGLLDHSVPLICHSFQELIHHFNLVPATTTSAPGKRFVLDSILNLVNTTTIVKDLQLMLDLIGSDGTEQACEQAGHKYLTGLLDHSVPLICHSFQELIHHFNLVPATTTSAPGKRFVLDSILNLVNTTTIVKDLQLMLDLIGSDGTEQACEQAGHKYLTGLLDHSVPLICHSFQELIHHFNLVPATTSAPGKRFVLDSILNLVNTTTIVKDLQLMLDLIGSDGTEQACEQAGHKYLTGLLDHSVPLICHSFQELIHHFNLVPATTTSAPGKRFVLDSILNLVNTTTIVKDLQLMLDLIGSDGTEQACEQAGHKYLTGLLDHSVPLICHSFQELIHHFNLVPATTTSAPGKRFVLDSILNLVNTTTIVKDLQLMLDLIGSDGTEQACEQAGHKYLTGLLDHSVPLICHSFQELIHHFNLVPATTTSAPGKRFVLDSILNLVNTTTIVKDLQLMLDLIGSDGTEQACEQAGHKYLTGLLDHSVPLICHSFQELIHHFNLVPATTTSAPGKRFVLDSILNLVNTTTIVKDLQLMLDLIGSDGTEQACEQAGHKYLTGLLDHSVPLICHSFQELIHHFNLVPATTTSAPGKRFVLDSILNLVNTTTIVKDLQLMLDLIGSNGTEQACEQAGHKYLTGLLDHSVPLICHSFQELVHHFNLVPATTSAPGKRFIVDSILNLVNTTTIVKDLQLMLDLIGSNGTEQACEQAGHKYLTGLLDHSVPLICHSFQELIHHYNLVPATTSAPGKRFIVDSILNLVNTTTIVKDLQLMLDLIGSDGTEQACEQAGHKYLTGLLDHSVPLICHSFQELIHHYNLVPATTTSAPGKRFVLDDILNLVDTTTIVADLQLMLNLIGSDGTEQACETAGHKYLTGLLDNAVPLVCHSFQELVKHYNLVPVTTTAAAAGR